ncbi:TetR family transcriptional regulator [Brevibacillus choshinensis]|uniref:TetR family transcriptional regulator n=1 Tax=Brevibacillus choshinensis TaxID=54911 RepID=A0ABR5MZH8_BRECH|nr:TetR/AcrR family transcriptional regulator [Brevibacillus choshinensis]KQL43509.1 TetR family transcriptional regulator [Brevibacillus choshinensis]
MSARPREFKDTTVIDAAMEVFWEHGFEGSSTEKLCERTGLGRGSLYNAFGSKHALYEKALERYQELGIEIQVEVLEQPGPVKDRLRALMEWGIDQDFHGEERRGCLAINAAIERGAKDSAVARLVGGHVGRLEQALCHVIAIGQRSGEITSKRPALELARSFLSSFYGLRVLGKVVEDRSVLEDVVEGTLAAL